MQIRRAAPFAALLTLAACDKEPEVEPVAVAVPSADVLYTQSLLADDAASCAEKVTMIAPALDVAPRRVMIAIDASGSMAAEAGDMKKMEIAEKAISDFVTKLPEGTEVGMIAFGHKGDNDEKGKEASCAGVELVYPVGVVDPDQLAKAADSFDATGWTPLAAAIKMSAEQLDKSTMVGEQVIWVISDGKETCGGDPIAAAREAAEGDARAVINIVGLELPQEEVEDMKKVAEAGGGAFSMVKGPELSKTFVAELERIEKATARAKSDAYKAGNRAVAMKAIEEMNKCISDLTTAEQAKLEAALTEAGEAGATDALATDAKARLKQRHDAIRSAMTEYTDNVKTMKNMANSAIEERLDAALRGTDQT